MKKLSDLTPAPYNPRTISDEKLAMLEESLKEFGDLSGIVYNRRTKRLVGGHQRQKAMPGDAKIKIEKEWESPTPSGTVAMGYVEVNGEDHPYREVDWPEEKEIAGNLAANKHGGEFDLPKLAPLLLKLDEVNYDLPKTGFTLTEIEDVVAPFRDMPADEDVVPAPPKVAKTKRGELWILGEHRLLIDDCTVKANVERLMAGEKAGCLYLDPPYGQLKIFNGGKVGNFSGSTRLAKQKEYGEYAGHVDFNREAFLSSAKAIDHKYMVVWGGNFFADLLPIRNSWLVWNKKAGARNMYSDFELAWTTLPVVGRSFEYVWQGMIRAGEKEERVHPTQKPIALHEWALGLVSEERDSDGITTVVDLTLGSGSTLIACEKTNRRCFGMEIEPIYGSVIIERWMKYTGKMAYREDGKSYEEICAEG